MKNIAVNYELLINLVSQELNIVKNSKEEFKKIKFVVCNEQMQIKKEDIDYDALYIVIKFNQSSISFGKAVVPFSISVCSLNNEIELTQTFLNTFVNEYNKVPVNDINQIYLTPFVNSNFNYMFNGMRSLLTVTGTFLIGDNTVTLTELTYYYGTGENDHEKIEVLGYSQVFENSLAPQPYPNTNGKTRSHANFSTFAFTIATYPDGTKNLIKNIMTAQFDETTLHINDIFNFSGVFSNSNINMPKWSFHLRSVDFNQKIGEIPTVTLTFTL